MMLCVALVIQNVVPHILGIRGCLCILLNATSSQVLLDCFDGLVLGGIARKPEQLAEDRSSKWSVLKGTHKKAVGSGGQWTRICGADMLMVGLDDLNLI